MKNISFITFCEIRNHDVPNTSRIHFTIFYLSKEVTEATVLMTLSATFSQMFLRYVLCPFYRQIVFFRRMPNQVNTKIHKVEC